MTTSLMRLRPISGVAVPRDLVLAEPSRKYLAKAGLVENRPVGLI
jgi:hypothetical protein